MPYLSGSIFRLPNCQRCIDNLPSHVDESYQVWVHALSHEMVFVERCAQECIWMASFSYMYDLSHREKAEGTGAFLVRTGCTQVV